MPKKQDLSLVDRTLLANQKDHDHVQATNAHRDRMEAEKAEARGRGQKHGPYAAASREEQKRIRPRRPRP